MCSLHENVHICKCSLEQPWSVLLQLYYMLAGAIHASIFGGSLGGVVQIRPGPIVRLVCSIAALGIYTGPSHHSAGFVMSYSHYEAAE